MTSASAAGGAYNFKVVLLGEGCVGKTSLLLRFIEDKFNDKHLTTLQATFLNKKLNLNGKRVNLSIWDTAGQEKFHALGPIYYRNSNGAILVYDITDEHSFGKVKNWVKELKKMLGSDICLMIAGNKVDLEQERTVPTEEAESYSTAVGATHAHTSAKLNLGVEELFLELTREMMARSLASARQGESDAGGSRVLVVDDEAAPQPSGCCGAPPKGKAPTKGAKQIVEENAATINFYRNMSLGACTFYAVITLSLYADSLTAWYICMNGIALLSYLGCYQIMKYISRPTFAENNQLLDSGLDLNMEGGMGEHVKDIVILTSITHALAALSNYFWLLLLLLPLRALWLLWSSILGPWFFQEAPQDAEQDDKKKKKMERKMKRYQ